MRTYYRRFQAKSLLNKKPVKKGDLIVSSEPFAFVINAIHIGEYCGYCLQIYKKKLLRPCLDCRNFWYCSERCQKLGHEDFHKYECPRLKRMFPDIPSPLVRLLARIIDKLKNGGDKIVEKYNERDGRKFKDLMNHYADVKADEEAQMELDKIIPALQKYMGKSALPNLSDFMGIYGRVLVNRFCLFDDTMMTFGSGLYLGASIFDHACIPNCYVSFRGRNVEIRSLVDMKEIDYNKLFIAYVDPVVSKYARQEDLNRRWFFWCECATCNNTDRRRMESSIICGRDGCDSVVYVGEEWDPEDRAPKCRVCDQWVDEKIVRKYREVAYYTMKGLKEMSEEDPNLPECINLLEMQGDMFHSLNVWKVKTLDFAFNACVFNGCWSLADTYGEQNLEGMRYYYGENNPTYGLFLLKLGKAKVYLKEFQVGMQYLEEAEQLLKEGIGFDHPLIENELIPTTFLANEDISIRLKRINKEFLKKEVMKGVLNVQKSWVSSITADGSISEEDHPLKNGFNPTNFIANKGNYNRMPKMNSENLQKEVMNEVKNAQNSYVTAEVTAAVKDKTPAVLSKISVPERTDKASPSQETQKTQVTGKETAGAKEKRADVNTIVVASNISVPERINKTTLSQEIQKVDAADKETQNAADNITDVNVMKGVQNVQKSRVSSITADGSINEEDHPLKNGFNPTNFIANEGNYNRMPKMNSENLQNEVMNEVKNAQNSYVTAEVTAAAKDKTPAVLSKISVPERIDKASPSQETQKTQVTGKETAGEKEKRANVNTIVVASNISVPERIDKTTLSQEIQKADAADKETQDAANKITDVSATGKECASVQVETETETEEASKPSPTKISPVDMDKIFKIKISTLRTDIHTILNEKTEVAKSSLETTRGLQKNNQCTQQLWQNHNAIVLESILQYFTDKKFEGIIENDLKC